MMKFTKIIILLSICFVSCSRYSAENYEIKKENDLVDKKVSIERKHNGDIGFINMKFDQKEIPISYTFSNKNYSYQIRFKIQGYLDEGSINVKLLNKFNGSNIVWEKTLSNGNILLLDRMDFYYRNYEILFEFNNAKNGDITIEYEIYI